MTKPAISVITCTYNRPEWLERAVASILAQTFENWELIIVNDGDAPVNLPDGAMRGAKLDPRIKIISQGHQGQPMAHNTGIRAATADLITFLDDDDTYQPFNLALKVAAMQKGEEMVYFPAMAVPGDLCGNHAFTEESLLAGLCVPNLCLVYKKSVFDRFGLHDERCPVYWDWDWQMRAFYGGLKGKFIDHAPIGEYYIHSTSVVRTKSSKTFHNALMGRATGKRTNELTLVVASYNYPQFLPRLIEGMFQQTCPNWRLIIVDDASPSPELKAMLRDLQGRYEHITVKMNRKNRGSCATFAQGFQMVETAYCAAIDADNFLLPDYVIRMIDHLDTHPAHVGAHCAFAQYVDMAPTGTIISKTPIVYENSLKQPPGTTLAAWRTEVALKILPEFELCPDWDMMLRGVEQGPVGYIKDPLVGWEDHKTSRWWWDLDESNACSDACSQAALERRGG
jgi:glycosyltransferase involved in cell wall biosynthesis